MHILVIPGRNPAVEYVRTHLPMRVLAQRTPGWRVTVVPLRQLHRLGEHEEEVDLLMLGSLLHGAGGEGAGAWITAMARQLPVVYDVDDHLLCPNPNPQRTLTPADQEGLRACLRGATAITTTTGYLAEVYRPLNPTVHVLPNCIDPDLWSPSLRAANPGQVVVGWFGGDTHREDLALVEEALLEVASRHPEVTLRFAGAAPPALATRLPGRVQVVPWVDDLPRVAATVAGLDIGLCPLVDSAFSRAKSPLKWIEYSALGIPVVASPVGPYLEIEPERTGLYASTPGEWVEAIGRLVRDPILGNRLAREARQEVLERHDINRHHGRWRQAYERIVEGHGARGGS